MANSAAFLASLGHNLRLSDADLTASPWSTPPTLCASSPPLPPLSPLSFVAASPHAAPASPEAGFFAPVPWGKPANAQMQPPPAFDARLAESDDERAEGLQLVAESVAQQRLLVSRHVLLPPVHMAACVLLVLLLVRCIHRSPSNLAVIAMAVEGSSLVCLSVVMHWTKAYLRFAKDIDGEWLGHDRIIVVKRREVVIGALVLGWIDDCGRRKGRSKKRGRAMVRAWTVKLQHRGQGVGAALLDEAAQLAEERGADGIEFAREHASASDALLRCRRDC